MKQSSKVTSMSAGVTQWASSNQAVVNVILRFTSYCKWPMAARWVLFRSSLIRQASGRAATRQP